ncbi:unnamed protein product, partial [Rotaria magnacalcarata]
MNPSEIDRTHNINDAGISEKIAQQHVAIANVGQNAGYGVAG